MASASLALFGSIIHHKRSFLDRTDCVNDIVFCSDRQTATHGLPTHMVSCALFRRPTPKAVVFQEQAVEKESSNQGDNGPSKLISLTINTVQSSVCVHFAHVTRLRPLDWDHCRTHLLLVHHIQQNLLRSSLLQRLFNRLLGSMGAQPPLLLDIRRKTPTKLLQTTGAAAHVPDLCCHDINGGALLCPSDLLLEQGLGLSGRHRWTALGLAVESLLLRFSVPILQIYFACADLLHLGLVLGCAVLDWVAGVVLVWYLCGFQMGQDQNHSDGRQPSGVPCSGSSWLFDDLNPDKVINN